MKCHLCGREAAAKPTKAGRQRVPAGWKRHQDQPWCQTCWRHAYILRAVTFPVASPIGLDWPAFRARLGAAWAQATEVANTVLTALAKADVVRSPSLTKLPPAPKLNVYQIARERRPDMESQAAAAVSRMAQQKYNSARWATIWSGSATLPWFRYPVPYPAHNASWQARWLSDTERVPVVSVRLGGERISLRLRGGAGFRRQLGAFEQIVSGQAVPGELALYRKRVSGNTHRPGLPDRAAGGGARQCYDVMVKLVAWLPKPQRPAPVQRRLVLSRAPDAFWIAEVEGREPWRLHADHVRRWIAAHRRQLDRLSDDSKYEVRLGEPPRLGEYRQAQVAKHHRRVRSFMQQSCSALAKFAQRQGVNTVVYDETQGGYLPEFPWHELQVMLANKLREFGMACECAGAVESLDTAREP